MNIFNSRQKCGLSVILKVNYLKSQPLMCNKMSGSLPKAKLSLSSLTTYKLQGK